VCRFICALYQAIKIYVLTRLLKTRCKANHDQFEFYSLINALEFFALGPLRSENGGMIIDFYPFVGEKWAIKLARQISK
jgi:hypothetical protein